MSSINPMVNHHSPNQNGHTLGYAPGFKIVFLLSWPSAFEPKPICQGTAMVCIAFPSPTRSPTSRKISSASEAASMARSNSSTISLLVPAIPPLVHPACEVGIVPTKS